jgi:large subunit ribosomal protein L24
MPRVSVSFSTVTQAAKIGPMKAWEHYKLTANGKPVRLPMPMKSGDTVKIIAGSDKGKVGKITKVVTKMGQIIVEGVNIKTKHNKPVREGEPGNISERESPIHHSNAMLYSTAEKVASRIGYKIGEDGKKVRYLKKTGEVLK